MAQRVYNFDALLEMKDAGLVAASAAAQVDSAAKIVDLGVGRFEGLLVVDVSAIEIASNDELYRIVVQGSSSATFASDIQNLASLDLGATEVRDGSGIDSVAGRYEIPFQNEQNDIRYRYLRVYTFVDGTIATGINYTAFVATKY
jgi:hypothetical protein